MNSNLVESLLRADLIPAATIAPAAKGFYASLLPLAKKNIGARRKERAVQNFVAIAQPSTATHPPATPSA